MFSHCLLSEGRKSPACQRPSWPAADPGSRPGGPATGNPPLLPAEGPPRTELPGPRPHIQELAVSLRARVEFALSLLAGQVAVVPGHPLVCSGGDELLHLGRLAEDGLLQGLALGNRGSRDGKVRPGAPFPPPPPSPADPSLTPGAPGAHGPTPHPLSCPRPARAEPPGGRLPLEVGHR